ncbi:MAG: tetratricopeptide repeat protein [Verrucomicrobiota bacterium]|jgi:tetratricopeptide (TPR) repeat protein
MNQLAWRSLFCCNSNNSERESSIVLNPVAFISSFYKEAGFQDHHDSPLWRLRRAIYGLKDTAEFAEFRAANPNREIAWVAECSEPGLGEGLGAVDRLVEVLAQSDLYICVLADARRVEKEHGSPIPVRSFVSATSYFEIELYAAAMHAKCPYLFVQEGFNPGPRLETLLRLLAFAIPDWRNQETKPTAVILEEVRHLIVRHIRQPEIQTHPLRQRLVRQLYMDRAEKAPPGHELENVLFLDGQFEQRQPPQKDLVEFLLAEYDRVPEMQRKLSRMWLAARELMSASYLPKDVQADSRLADFLPLWDKVLGFWTSAASWSGWHGHLYAGTVAPLHSQAIIREQLPGSHAPSGPLASAYYSIGNLMPFGLRRLECLKRSLQYIEEAIYLSGGRNPGHLAVRGSIRMHLGNPWGAVSDFKRMLQMRERMGESEEKLGDAMVHLGYGYLFCGRWWKGRGYLERGIEALSKNPNDPGIARAQRKLAIAYRLTGRFPEARNTRAKAQQSANRLGALDQLDR